MICVSQGINNQRKYKNQGHFENEKKVGKNENSKDIFFAGKLRKFKKSLFIVYQAHDLEEHL